MGTIESWNFRYLSVGGKETLIKSVLPALPIYAVQCFLLPKLLCAHLENVLNRFLWTNSKMLKSIHWLSWRDLCVPKYLGGLGFRDFNMFNISLLVKQCWRIWTQPNRLLSRVLKAPYYAKSEFLSAELGSYPSLNLTEYIGC